MNRRGRKERKKHVNSIQTNTIRIYCAGPVRWCVLSSDRKVLQQLFIHEELRDGQIVKIERWHDVPTFIDAGIDRFD